MSLPESCLQCSSKNVYKFDPTVTGDNNSWYCLDCGAKKDNQGLSVVGKYIQTEDICCSRCGNKDLVGCQYIPGSQEAFDGVSEWQCYKCKMRIGRWTGKILADDELESRGGKRGAVKKK